MKALRVLGILILAAAMFVGDTDFVSTSTWGQDQKTIVKEHQQFIYTVVRVRHKTAGGSGVLIRSAKEDQDNFCNYVITNHHVVGSAIKHVKEYSTFTKQMEDKEKLDTVNVEIFRYMNTSKLMDRSVYDANILTYDKSRDIALLMFRTVKKLDFVAKLPAKGKAYYMLQEVYSVGAALSHKPVATRGQITSLDEKIENLPFFLCSSPIIYGNSGGATFLVDTGEFIGVPARIDALKTRFGSTDSVTHLAYIIPVDEVYKSLDRNGYGYVWDMKQNWVDCAKKRRAARQGATLKRLQDAKNKIGKTAIGGTSANDLFDPMPYDPMLEK